MCGKPCWQFLPLGDFGAKRPWVWPCHRGGWCRGALPIGRRELPHKRLLIILKRCWSGVLLEGDFWYNIGHSF